MTKSNRGFELSSVMFLVVALLFFIQGNYSEYGRFCLPVSGENHIYSWQCLYKTFQTPELVTLDQELTFLNSKQWVSKEIEKPLSNMLLDARKDGMCLVVSSGYRNPEAQQALYNKARGDEKKKVAQAYGSEHQTGLAVDLVACPINENGERDDSVERLELKNSFETLPEYKWLLENANKYGFVQSYRLDNEWLTGYPQESWHWKHIK